MKLALIVILLFIVMLIALGITNQYKDKYNFYQNLKQFLTKLKLNISFKKDTILDFLNNFDSQKTFKTFILDYQKYLQGQVLDLSNLQVLEDADKQMLTSIMQSIGNYDTNGELNQLETFMSEIEEKLLHAKQDKEKLCPMIIKLSFLFALAVAIVLI